MIVVRYDNITYFLDMCICIAHCNCETGSPEYVQIIIRVSDGYGLLDGYIQILT